MRGSTTMRLLMLVVGVLLTSCRQTQDQLKIPIAGGAATHEELRVELRCMLEAAYGMSFSALYASDARVGCATKTRLPDNDEFDWHPDILVRDVHLARLRKERPRDEASQLLYSQASLCLPNPAGFWSMGPFSTPMCGEFEQRLVESATDASALLLDLELRTMAIMEPDRAVSRALAMSEFHEESADHCLAAHYAILGIDLVSGWGSDPRLLGKSQAKVYSSVEGQIRHVDFLAPRVEALRSDLSALRPKLATLAELCRLDGIRNDLLFRQGTIAVWQGDTAAAVVAFEALANAKCEVDCEKHVLAGAFAGLLSFRVTMVLDAISVSLKLGHLRAADFIAQATAGRMATVAVTNAPAAAGFLIHVARKYEEEGYPGSAGLLFGEAGRHLVAAGLIEGGTAASLRVVALLRELIDQGETLMTDAEPFAPEATPSYRRTLSSRGIDWVWRQSTQAKLAESQVLALFQLQNVLGFSPDDGLRRVARLLLSQMDPVYAGERYGRMLEQQRKNVEAWGRFVQAAQSRGDCDSRLTWLKRARETWRELGSEGWAIRADLAAASCDVMAKERAGEALVRMMNQLPVPKDLQDETGWLQQSVSEVILSLTDAAALSIALNRGELTRKALESLRGACAIAEDPTYCARGGNRIAQDAIALGVLDEHFEFGGLPEGIEWTAFEVERHAAAELLRAIRTGKVADPIPWMNAHDMLWFGQGITLARSLEIRRRSRDWLLAEARGERYLDLDVFGRELELIESWIPVQDQGSGLVAESNVRMATDLYAYYFVQHRVVGVHSWPGGSRVALLQPEQMELAHRIASLSVAVGTNSPVAPGLAESLRNDLMIPLGLPRTNVAVVRLAPEFFGLPFEMLLSDDEGDVQVVYSDAFWTDRAVERHAAPSVVVVGNNGLSLRGAESEADSIANIWGVDWWKTKKELLDRAGGADIIHLAARAVEAVQNPYDTGIELADSNLSARELIGVARGAWVVVLSSCESARVPGLATVVGHTSTGPLSPAAAAHQSGVEWVVSSRWKIDDKVVQDFMSVFHRCLKSSGDPVSAFREARLKFRNASKYYQLMMQLSVRDAETADASVALHDGDGMERASCASNRPAARQRSHASLHGE